MKKTKFQSDDGAFKKEISEILDKMINSADESVDSSEMKMIEIKEIFPTTENDLRKLDKWCVKQLLANPNVIFIKDKPYPYKKYHHIDSLLIKYGKSFVDDIHSKCPYKSSRDEVEDSLSWGIYSNKIDIKSIISGIPEYQSIWDRISDHGHA